jgi:hypothetical protein
VLLQEIVLGAQGERMAAGRTWRMEGCVCELTEKERGKRQELFVFGSLRRQSMDGGTWGLRDETAIGLLPGCLHVLVSWLPILTASAAVAVLLLDKQKRLHRGARVCAQIGKQERAKRVGVVSYLERASG